MARGKKAAADAGPVEGLWELPEGWHWERLDAVAPVNPGRNLGAASDGEEVTFLPMAAVAELSGKIDLTQRRKAETVRSGFTRFRTGDVIFAKITPCMENGKLAVIPDIPFGVGAGSTEFHVLEPQQVSSKYLFYWLSQQTFRDRAERNMQGAAGQRRVPADWLRSSLVPIPPNSSVQDDVVGCIDRLFAEIDEGEAALAEARGGVETYRKALLKAAVTGELTADWRRQNPPRETGKELLGRILAERRARWQADPKNARKKYLEPTGPDTDGLPKLPGGWIWASLEQLATHEVRNGLSIKEASVSTEVRALRLGALAGEEVDWSLFRYLPIASAAAVPYRLENGDLLVSRANGSPHLVGKASICINPPDDMIFPDTAIRYRLLGGTVVRRWLVTAWTSPLVRGQIANLAKTTAGILKISQDDIASVAVPLAGGEELAKANELASAAHPDMIENDLSALFRTPSTLRQSILAAAFRGELTA